MVTYIFASIAIIILIGLLVVYRANNNSIHVTSAKSRINKRSVNNYIGIKEYDPYHTIAVDGIEVNEIDSNSSVWHSLSTEQKSIINAILSDQYIGAVPVDQNKRKFSAVCRSSTT